MEERFPRLLIVDHADSYTLNLLPLLLRSCPHLSPAHVLARCVVVSHTDPRLTRILPHVDALILGPGPGHPSNAADFGASLCILKRMLDSNAERRIVPTLGVCLGHQGLAVATGGQVKKAQSIRHGVSSHLERLNALEGCQWGDIFEGLQDQAVDAIRYNSLNVVESSLSEDQLKVTAISHDDGDRSVMGLQHTTLPLWGVQFHPESICSGGGATMLANFIRETARFWDTSLPSISRGSYGSELPQWVKQMGSKLVESALPLLQLGLTVEETECKERRFKVISRRLQESSSGKIARPEVFDKLFRSKGRSVWLDGSRQGDPQSRFSYMGCPSFSLSYDIQSGKLALSQPNRPTINYIDVSSPNQSGIDTDVVDNHGLLTPITSRPASPTIDGTKSVSPVSSTTKTFWSFLDAFQKQLQAKTLLPDEDDRDGAPPFVTGFVGYFSYEMKGESLPDRGHTKAQSRRKEGKYVDLSDANFGFCDRILAYDDEKQEWTAFALLREKEGVDVGGNDELDAVVKALEGNKIGLNDAEIEAWFDEVQKTVDRARMHDEMPRLSGLKEQRLPPLAPLDGRDSYIKKVERCRHYISQGNSYELCLTTRFRGEMDAPAGDNTVRDEVWATYKSLRQRNPAPYSAYLELDDDCKRILSTSPERFMSLSKDGAISMKPIKGTLARAGYKQGDHQAMCASGMGESAWKKMVDEERRKALEADPKERAENLMIVDLIRNDLVSFCDPASVVVPRLMVVESYESVHQLVTTVSAKRSRPDIGPVECLRRSFPPGSMTGAPKQRSCELLDELENGVDRGVYSGILGWIGLDGAATFSVVIRTACFDGSHVEVGAGGAITYLSEADKEWQEALDKVNSIASVHK